MILKIIQKFVLRESKNHSSLWEVSCTEASLAGIEDRVVRTHPYPTVKTKAFKCCQLLCYSNPMTYCSIALFIPITFLHNSIFNFWKLTFPIFWFSAENAQIDNEIKQL